MGAGARGGPAVAPLCQRQAASVYLQLWLGFSVNSPPLGQRPERPQSASGGLPALCYSSGSRRSRASGFGRESVTDPSILHSSLTLAEVGARLWDLSESDPKTDSRWSSLFGR